MARLRALGRLGALRIPRAVLMLSGIAIGTIGSCTLPSIKPPGL
jgi:hypothetical protein